MIFGDFETRSAVDLRKVGAYEYAKHPSTEVMCLAWALDDEPVQLWHPYFRDWTNVYAKRKIDRVRMDLPESVYPNRLHRLIKKGETFEAHNAFFERCIWQFIMVERWGWPEVQDWRCSAALAASYALRPKLDHVTRDLRLVEHKDKEGHAVMLKHCKPRTLLKRERRIIAVDNLMRFDELEAQVQGLKLKTCGDFVSIGLEVSRGIARYKQEREGLERLFAYCKQDVVAERQLHKALRPLSDDEQKVWQLDQSINWTGIHMDTDLVEAAIKIGDAGDADAQVELGQITNGDVTKASQRDSMKAWLKDQGTKVPTKLNQKGKTIETIEADAMKAILERDPPEPEHVRRACEIWIAVNKTSTKKYRAIQRRVSDDNRVRETVRYHAASTGRWGGQGIQPHNFPRKCPTDMEATCRHVMSGDYELIRMLYGRDNVMTLLSSILRGTITAAPGNDLIASDYSSIEACGTFWISGHVAGLKILEKLFRGDMPGQDIYTWMASDICGRLITKADDHERQGGKAGILGGGYQMGGPKLVTYAAKMGIILTEERAIEIIAAYRRKNKPVVEFWKTIQDCAMEAIYQRGKVIRQGRIAWRVYGRFLHCELPSGRLLSYLDPKVVEAMMPWGRPGPQIQFSGTDTYTRKWKRTSTYGGKLTENVVQALCRDIMAEAMVRVIKMGYPIVLTVHDEIVSEVEKGFGSVEEFNAILTQQPEWADGMPIAANGWRGERYRK